MLDNKTIQLKGREWEYSAAQANGNNNGKSRGGGGGNKLRYGKWVKKHFQADCSSRKG